MAHRRDGVRGADAAGDAEISQISGRETGSSGVHGLMPAEREVRLPSSAAPEALFEMLYPELRKFASVVASPDIDPDDLVQEALAKVLRSGSLDEIDNPGAYFRQAILNLEISHRRRWARWRQRAHRAPMMPLRVEATYPSDLALLQCLAPFDRALLYLTVVEDLPYAVVADMIGGNEKTLRSRASKAKSRLRGVLAKEEV